MSLRILPTIAASSIFSRSFAILFAAGLLVAGCGAAVGGGGSGGSGAATAGGAPGTVCIPTTAGEGCSSAGGIWTRVKCTPNATDPTKFSWQPIAACLAGEACVATTPEAGSATKKVSECKGAAATDAGGTGDATTGNDSTVANDGTVAGDGTVLSDTPAGADAPGVNDVPVASDVPVGQDVPVGKDTVTTVDTSPGAILACLQVLCSAELGNCLADSPCAAAISCASGCGNDNICLGKCIAPMKDNADYGALQVCGQKNNRIPGGTSCGNGKCEQGETPSSCPADCKEATVCGDGQCNGSETASSCPKDCNAACCESKGAACGLVGGCPLPCGECPNGKNCSNNQCVASTSCGDGICNGSETTNTCPKDCPPAIKCGDGVCNGGETTQTCPGDCPAAAVCGDGKCVAPESESSCPADCSVQAKCLTANCADEMAACKQDVTCVALSKCVGLCKDQACSDNCGAAADQAAIDEWDAYVQCGISFSCIKVAAPVCGDGKCEAPENATSCKADCAVVSGNYCDTHCGAGPSPGGCYCDAACKNSKDCCTNAAGTLKGATCLGSTCGVCK